jgi:hypothetical protein
VKVEPSKRLTPSEVQNHRKSCESRKIRCTRLCAKPSAEVYDLIGKRSACAVAYMMASRPDDRNKVNLCVFGLTRDIIFFNEGIVVANQPYLNELMSVAILHHIMKRIPGLSKHQVASTHRDTRQTEHTAQVQ